MFEAIKKIPRKLDRAAETASFDYPRVGGRELAVVDLIGPEKSVTERVTGLFHLIQNSVSPEVYHALTGNRYKFQKEVLPVDPDTYALEEEKVGKGAECNVYKLASCNPEVPSLVVKIDRVKAGASTDELVKRGKHMSDEYEENRQWYAKIEDFIPEEHQFISRSPRGGRVALVTIQKFFGDASHITDIFRGLSEEALLDILRHDERLRGDFRKFIELTLDRVNWHDKILDTLGDNNVSLIQTPAGTRLIFLDPHLVYRVSDDKERNIESRREDLAYLQKILASIEKIDAEITQQQT